MKSFGNLLKSRVEVLLFILLALLIFVSTVLKYEAICFVLFSIIAVFITFFCGYYISKKENQHKIVISILLVGLIIRVFVVALNRIYPIITFPDSEIYDIQSLRIVEQWQEGIIIPQLPASHFLYYFISAAVYFVFGYQPALVQIINCLFGVLAGLNIYSIVKREVAHRTAVVALFLSMIFPSLIIWQSSNLKESLVTFLITLVLNRLSVMCKKPGFINFFIAIVFILLLTITRNYAGIFLGGVTCLLFLIVSRIKVKFKIIFVTVTIMLFGVITYYSGMGLFGVKFLQIFNLHEIDILRKTDYAGGSAVLQNMSMGTVPELIVFLPIALVYFLFSPFPWQIDGSMLQFYSLVENLVWYSIFTFVPLGIVVFSKRSKIFSATVLLSALGFCALYSMQMSNMGLAYRMRSQLLPIFFIFASVGFDLVFDKWKQKTIPKEV